MSAGPPVPPHRYGLSTSQRPPTNGASGNISGTSGRFSLSTNGRNPSADPTSSKVTSSELSRRAQREVKDLQHVPIKHLLDHASNALRSAQTLYQFKKPIQAFYEYLVVGEIISVALPAHKSWPEVRSSGPLGKQFKEIVQGVDKISNIFDAVKLTLPAEDSTRSASITNPEDPGLNGTRRPHSLANGRPTQPVQPHPEHTIRTTRPATMINGSSLDDLSSRFAKLRPAKEFSSRDNDVKQAMQPTLQQSSNGTFRPQLDSRTSLPKQPDPTYSPTRATPFSPSSRSSTITMHSERPSSVASSSALAYSTSEETQKYASTVHCEPDESAESKKRRRANTNDGLGEVEVSAERLYDYMRTVNVLLIDVRTREDFDEGHISSRAVVCVEPAALRPHMSADELQDALILSPDEEQIFFARRDDFDVVVYYDQRSSGAGYLNGYSSSATPHLRHLHEALTDYNEAKSLRHPPMLLVGGLDAWAHLVGKHTLQPSETAAKQKKAIPRKSLNSDAAKLYLPKRSHRTIEQLDPEEERKWRERARSESIKLTMPPADGDDDDDDDDERSDFAIRYPDVASVEERTLASRAPIRPPPEPPRPISYPAPPALSAPSRPPPIMARPSYSGVSEKTMTPTLPPKVMQLPAYIPPQFKRIPRMGLHNFGVTCYMNATLQCLSATVPLTVYFLEEKWKKHLQEENWKGSKGVLAALYSTLLSHMWLATDVSILKPTNFRNLCGRLNREWGITRQQDAKEFLEFLIDTFHEDLNVHWARQPLQELSPADEAVRERMPPFKAAQHEWQRYLHRDESKLTYLFGGQHISKLQCTTCRHTSTTYEAFYSISVEIPRLASSSRISIYDCLESYCSAERLSGSEVWRCPQCKREREAIKRITISRAPEFLVIHFKRFSASHSERATKIHTEIDFPLTGLDIARYMLPSPPAAERERIASTDPRANIEAYPPSMTPPYKYNAYAVMKHIGNTLTSGHYIANVYDKARNTWREFNDDRVTDFQASQRKLQNKEAYIVFYQRDNGDQER